MDESGKDECGRIRAWEIAGEGFTKVSRNNPHTFSCNGT